MKTYLAGTTVKLKIHFRDEDENDLDVESAVYRIVDDKGIELLPQTTFELPTVEDSEEINLYQTEDDEKFYTLTVDASLNQVTPVDLESLTAETMQDVRLSEVRIVEFELTLKDGNVYPLDVAYAVVPKEQLIVGYNSFQTQREAYLTALTTPNVVSWETASKEERISSMIEAHRRICGYYYNDSIYRGIDRLETSYEYGNDISFMTAKDFAKLSPDFIKALKHAQIAESNTVIGGVSQSEELRRQGMISQTIGETQEIWRSSKPIDFSVSVSRDALRYLSKYIVTVKKIGRA